MKMNKYLKILLFLFTAPCFAQQVCKDDIKNLRDERKQAFSTWKTGVQVPNIQLTNQSLYALTSNTTIILFWKTDCPYCERLLPQLEQLSKEYAKNQLAVVAICLDKDLQQWQQQDSVKNPLPLWYHKCEGQGFMAQDAENFSVFGTPALLVIDKDHKIKGHPKSLEQLKNLIR